MRVPLRWSCPLRRCSTLMLIFFLLSRYRAGISSSAPQTTKLILIHKFGGSRGLKASAFYIFRMYFNLVVCKARHATLLHFFLLCFLQKLTHSLFTHSTRVYVQGRRRNQSSGADRHTPCPHRAGAAVKRREVKSWVVILISDLNYFII